MRSFLPNGEPHVDWAQPDVIDWFGLLVRGWWIMLVVTVLALGLAYVQTTRQAPVYRARATFLVMPSEGVINSSNEAIINSINTLDRPTAMNTFAEIASSPAVTRQALATLGYAMAEADDAQVRAVVLPETFAIEVLVEAGDPAKAAAVANAVAQEAGQFGARSYPAFQTQVLDVATPPLRPIKPQPSRDLAVAGLGGLALGILVAFSLDQLRRPTMRQAVLTMPGAVPPSAPVAQRGIAH